MDYIITKNKNTYVKFDKQSKMTLTTNLSSAQRFHYDKAMALINNSVNPKERNMYDVALVKINGDVDHENTNNYSPTMFDTMDFNWLEMCENIQSFFSDLPQYKQNLQIKHKEVEAERIDIEHYIEFNDLNACKGYKAFKLLQETMRKRRKIKDEMQIVNEIIDTSIENFTNDCVINRIKALDERAYRPRILAELFEN